ncbi:hypothetical protein F5H01DRAFT_339386 [Linnemannia elongata]|nr:hypothetical protein F5H01DRAFT_339386 [Linnemannia elongata]
MHYCYCCCFLHFVIFTTTAANFPPRTSPLPQLSECIMTKQKGVVKGSRGRWVGQRRCVWGSAKKSLEQTFFLLLLLISEVKGRQEVREKGASKREKKSV